MVYITELWIPIVLSAVVVFVASSIIHMVLPYHRKDFRELPDEAKVLEGIRAAGVPPGDYQFPCPASPKEMSSPAMLEKYNRGPVGIMTVLPPGPPAMGKSLVLWFVFCLAMGVFVAYVCGRTLAAGAEYLRVFQIGSTVGFLGYAAAEMNSSIWKGQAWSTTLKHVFDGLVYALLTAGVFGWLWP